MLQAASRRVTLHGNGLQDRRLAMASPVVLQQLGKKGGMAAATGSRRWLTNTCL